jgi:hypothetical protein
MGSVKRPEFDTLPQREDETVYTCMIMYRGLKETCETSGSLFQRREGYERMFRHDYRRILIYFNEVTDEERLVER